MTEGRLDKARGGWTKWRGGKVPPVEKGKIIDVLYRDGKASLGVIALVEKGDYPWFSCAGTGFDQRGNRRSAFDWTRTNSDADIVAYRNTWKTIALWNNESPIKTRTGDYILTFGTTGGIYDIVLRNYIYSDQRMPYAITFTAIKYSNSKGLMLNTPNNKFMVDKHTQILGYRFLDYTGVDYDDGSAMKNIKEWAVSVMKEE